MRLVNILYEAKKMLKGIVFLEQMGVHSYIRLWCSALGNNLKRIIREMSEVAPLISLDFKIKLFWCIDRSKIKKYTLLKTNWPSSYCVFLCTIEYANY